MQLPKKILIVEDEMITQRYLKDILSQMGISTVISFDNADDTLSFFEKDTCDMILMDINISGSMDGTTLTKKILENHDLPVIFISAYRDKDILDEVQSLSHFGFVAKPFTIKEVELTVQDTYKRFLTFQ